MTIASCPAIGTAGLAITGAGVTVVSGARAVAFVGAVDTPPPKRALCVSRTHYNYMYQHIRHLCTDETKAVEPRDVNI